ncbi:hypothetical protein CNMCM5793_006125 [Aspergillus hiratsukae]|uniref:ribonuclease H n=1 Tax=Aspergillus hiratsukae TaxID=1194566 RepID=A0A8H6P011_9EURO|nr:hypothetical protein CNMCM5793_006125 [Aspergillus hiratsukae]KAF7173179.1 hypothetical protein CNMCM6106_007317 [Aspergillus hiratsukae]
MYIEPPLPPLRMLPTDRGKHLPSPLEVTVYSDGSRTDQGAGYGYAIYYGPILLTQGFGPAGARTEVYDAEIMGAVEGLRAAVSQDCTKFTTQINILLDNLAAASLLADGRPAPHKQGLTDTFHQLSAQWDSLPSLLSIPCKPVRVCWVPGHSGVAGNELTDELAKKGASIASPDIPPSPSFLRREVKQQIRADTCVAYFRGAPQAYCDLDIKPHTKGSRDKEHKLPHWVLGRLIATHTGHRDFAAYHERFQHANYLATYPYKRQKSPVYFFFYPHTRKH